MPALAEQFRDAKSRVEPKEVDTKNAIDAHLGLREAVENCEELKDMGIDTVLIGSYARHVSIHRMRDVDVLSKLPDADEREPGALLDTFEACLVATFGSGRVGRQTRSLKVEFPDYDLGVDAVPARPHGKHWEIPDRSGGWEETNPLRLAALTSAMNERYDEHYVPTVKLVRQTRRAQLGESQPGGLYLEVATYHAFAAGIEAEDSAEYYCAALEGIASQLKLAITGGLPDPTLPGRVIVTRATTAQLQRAADVFAQIAKDTRAALDSDEPCPAALTFRNALGRNSDDEWVFPMPSYCNDDGTPRSSTKGIAAGSSTVPDDRHFA